MKHSLQLSVLVLALAACSLISAHPMVSPEIDESAPFSYYSRPTDQLGVICAPKGFMVTSEGYLYNRAAELLFLYGPSLELVHNRQRTLMDGIYPVICYSLEKLGVRYDFEMFAFTVERDKPRSDLEALVKVTMTNVGQGPNTATFAAGIRQKGITTRIEEDRDFAFQRESTYDMRGDYAMRNDLVIAYMPNHPSRRINSTIDNGYKGMFKGSEFAVTETTPVCLSTYNVDLGPGQSESLVFLMPNVPASWNDMADYLRDKDLAKLYEQKLSELKEDWDAFYSKMVDIRIPEDKVQKTLQASLMNIAISMDDEGNGFFSQGVNEMQYTGFFPRDSMYFAWSWYFAGMQDMGQRVMEYYAKQQHEDGRFWNDQENIAPFSILKWYRLTKNLDYATRMWPRLLKNFNCVTNLIAKDPLQLMPAMGPYDNEGITGHYTAHNFYNSKAFEYLADLATTLGHTNEAKTIAAYGKAFTERMLKKVDEVVEAHGLITPGLDTGTSGAHWGNMEASYPTFVYGSRDERVRKTIAYIREKDWSDEGLIMFNALGCHCLHHYNTMKASMADLYLGHDKPVIQDLYGVLLHTSSTHGFFEFCLDPWSNRDFGGNVAPHGWGHVKYISLIRHMMVREDEVSNLYLLSALSPNWVLPGKELVARRLPTVFGKVDMVINGTREGFKASIELDKNGGTWGLPRNIYVKVPYFAQLASVFVDGHELPQDEMGFVKIPLETKEIEMKFRRSLEPAPSYKSTVQHYIAAYKEHFAAWRKDNPYAQVWESFPEKELETFEKRQVRDQQLRMEEGLMVFLPVMASSSSPKTDAKYLNDGIANDRTTRFWRPSGDDKTPWFECVFEEPVMAWCCKIMADKVGEAKAKVYVTDQEDKTELVGESGVPKLPIHGKSFVLTFPQRYVKKIRVEFEGPVGRVFECSLHGLKDCWHAGIPRQPGKVGDIAYGCPVFTTPSETPTEAALVDGDPDSATSLWSGAEPHPQWAIVDLGESQEFSRLATYFFHDGKRQYSYRYLVSDDMQDWKEIGGKDDYLSTREGDEITVEPVKARYVMLRVDKNTDNPACHVSEIEIYAK